jgi:hypothetical protein
VRLDPGRPDGQQQRDDQLGADQAIDPHLAPVAGQRPVHAFGGRTSTWDAGTLTVRKTLQRGTRELAEPKTSAAAGR